MAGTNSVAVTGASSQPGGASAPAAQQQQPSTSLALPGRFGPFGGPLSFWIFGQQKVGKTLAALQVAPGLTPIFTPLPAEAAAAVGYAGIQPWLFVTPTLEVATDGILYLIRERIRVAAILLDDVGIMAENTANALKRSGLDGWDLIQALRARIFNLRDLARYHLEAHTLFTSHEGGPKTIKGRVIRAGPLLPGQLTEDIAGPLEGVLRMVVDPMVSPRSTRFRTASDPAWVQGDKTGAVLDNGPANLAECLRAVGVPLPRYPGLEWQDEIAEAIAVELLAGMQQKEVLTRALYYIKQRGWAQDQRHVEWAFYDGLDRAELRRKRQNRLGTVFGIDMNWAPPVAPAAPQNTSNTSTSPGPAAGRGGR